MAHAAIADISGGSSGVRPTLKRGDKGLAVKELQEKLGIAADGNFGPDTQHAVQELQAAHNLKVDGIAGPEVNALLFEL
jgi:peptidoglycan hydrolase-like protein with peptidoglycan-binding domain